MRIGRIAEITRVFAEEGLDYLVEKRPPPETGEDGKQKPPSNAELAKRLRKTLERLGPTFVKFGQMLGTRVDLFGPEVIAELGQLHSHVPPFPNGEARAIIERELGAKIDEVFIEFPDAPIAAASIAQVYKARLRAPGEPLVAVKVQRPNLEQSLLSDLDVLVDVSGFVDALVPPYHRSMVHRVAQEYARQAKKEIDFLAEADAIEEFKEVLTTQPELRAPAVYRDRCTARVLVMEWLEGTKLDTLKDKGALIELGVDPTEFGRTMLRLQLQMSYEHGFVHGDTHPGNIILSPDGHVCLIDFGLHARVPRALRDKMLETLFYQASGKVDEAAAMFASLLAPDPSVNKDLLERDLKQVLAGTGKKRTLEDDKITTQLVEMMRVGASHKVQAQSELFMVVRNLTIVEGIVLRYAPGLDPAVEVKEITGAILRRRVLGPKMRDEMTLLLPQLLLTLSKRPQLIERLLRLERSFTDSKNLGEFLRKEKVIAELTYC